MRIPIYQFGSDAVPIIKIEQVPITLVPVSRRKRKELRKWSVATILYWLVIVAAALFAMMAWYK